MRATAVFTPGAFPAHTYVGRDGEALESALSDALETPGQIISLVGPSKSGKTVLVEKVVGQDRLVTVTGAGIATVDDLWARVSDALKLPDAQTSSSSDTSKVSGASEVSGEVSALGVGKLGAKLSESVGSDSQIGESATVQRRGLQDIIDRLGGSSQVLLIDDFHYMPRDVQSEAAKSLKEAVRRGVSVITAAVSHRGDDLVRANPELRGRVRSIDLQYWNPDDLRTIATAGFSLLNVQLSRESANRLVIEAAGSPQLMQSLCLTACFVLKIKASLETPSALSVAVSDLQTIFEQATASTDFRSLVDVIDSGPKTRGTERKLYKFIDGTGGDVYRAVLKSVAHDPPRLSFSYDDLSKRTGQICKGEAPVGSSVIGTCLHISRLAAEKFPQERAIDWDEQKMILDIPDPYLLFYLRWSERLTEAE